MKQFFLFSFMVITSLCYSNNINVSNVTLTGQNNALKFTLVKFDLSWENSWRTSTLESNWDAAWIFIKYRKKSTTVWNHATLNTTGYTAPAGSTINIPTDGKGIFMYKSADGIGTNTWTSAKLRWNYGVDGLLTTDSVEVCVFGIEMVYIPQGAFYLGDGSVTSVHGNFRDAASNIPLYITSEGALTLGGITAGDLGNNNATTMFVADDFNNSITQALPAAFPKGYNAFYIMKYETTQEQYVSFLNKLTYTQQTSRTAVAPNSAAGTGALINAFRNGIDIMTPGISASTPAVYACNLDADANYNEAGTSATTNDGQNIPCNYLTWADLVAYLDWSGLRPFTELEFEKACRGKDISALANEYAWGTTTITVATGITNSGEISEVASNAGANCTYNNGAGVQGPMRAGNFALATNRQNSGGSYYGVMELSGNNWERAVSVGSVTGRAFTDISGDGSLSAAGNADATNWPGNNGIGSCFRGGNWLFWWGIERVSARYHGNDPNTSRVNTYGGRGARIAP